jgi:circadian clock protein KaiB
VKRTLRSTGGRAQRRTVVRLYVAGSSRNSVAARKNLDAIIADVPDGALDLEVVDVFKFPERALSDGVLVTPMLIRLSPGPIQTIIGDLSDRDALRAVVGRISPDTRAVT